MKQDVIIDNHFVSYTVKRHSRAKHLSLAVFPGGEVVVTMPPGLRLDAVQMFIKKKAAWLIEKIHALQRVAPRQSKIASRGEYLAYKDRALALAKERIAFLRNIYGVKVNRVTVRNQSSRWGSCSKKGNLNFNYRIVFLPPSQLDYVIAHELAHLREFNHSPKFWQLVSRVSSSYRRIRKELRKKQLG